MTDYQTTLLFPSYTFDDVLLLPRYSDILPNEVEPSVILAKNLHLKIPILSSPMDTVTEHKLAIAMANEGGMGIIHRNLSIEQQANEVQLVKSKNKKNIVAAAIGVGADMKKRSLALLNV